MRDTIVGDGWRWVIVGLGFIASGIMAALLRMKVREARIDRVPVKRGEVTALIGGAAVCLFVATGTLGVILDLDSIFRLPFMATALAYTVAGRGAQLLNLRRRR